jgi:hypothetical protein
VSSLASHSARTRIPCLGPLLPPPDRGRNPILRACPRSQLLVADARELCLSTAVSKPLVSSALSFSSSWSKSRSKRIPVGRDRANSGESPVSRRRLRRASLSHRRALPGATQTARSATNGPDQIRELPLQPAHRGPVDRVHRPVHGLARRPILI